MKKYKLTLNSLKKAQEAYCRATNKCKKCPFFRRVTRKSFPFELHEACAEYAIQHPDKAIELMELEVVEVENNPKLDKPKLTEQELNICKLLGAKWVSRDGEGYNYMGVVKLWREKPQMGKSPCYYLTEGTYIATCELDCFPSLKPGDCVNVEDLLESSEQ